MGASCKGVVTLSDGREVSVDVSTLKNKEFRGFFDNSFPIADEDRVISRLTGLSAEEIGELLRDDFRRVFQKIVDLANRPLDDPKNSQSAST